MINKYFLFIVLFAVLSACNKKNDDKTAVVEYQVIATNSSNIEITYHNVLGDKIVTTAQNNWAFNISVNKPFTAYLKGTSTSPFGSIPSTCTVNILVNGSLVKTATISINAVAIAEAEYAIP